MTHLVSQEPVAPGVWDEANVALDLTAATGDFWVIRITALRATVTGRHATWESAQASATKLSQNYLARRWAAGSL